MESSERADAPPKRSWLAAVRDEIRTRPLAYLAIAGFCVMGPVFAHMIFPEAPLPLVIFGGVAFGLHFAFCALADKLFE
jgi:hypothetical protein